MQPCKFILNINNLCQAFSLDRQTIIPATDIEDTGYAENFGKFHFGGTIVDT